MPRAKLTKSAIDALPTPASELVYWDETLPGFGVKVTPAGRKVFIVLYRTAGAGSRLRKYTIGPVEIAPGDLDRVIAIRREALDCRDGAACCSRDGRLTGAHGIAVEMNGAGAASCDPAAVLGASEPELIAQIPEERHVGIAVVAALRPVHNESGHQRIPSW
jgi:hypothetical protein